MKAGACRGFELRSKKGGFFLSIHLYMKERNVHFRGHMKPTTSEQTADYRIEYDPDQGLPCWWSYKRNRAMGWTMLSCHFTKWGALFHLWRKSRPKRPLKARKNFYFTKEGLG